MAALAALTLSHFRSHRSASVVLDGRPVAIFGPNGAGKTNLIEAVSLLSPGRGLRGAETADLIRRPEALGWKITARFADGREVETWAEPGQSRQVRLDGKGAPQVALADVVPVLWLVPAMDRLWTDGAEGRRRFLDRLAMGFSPDHARHVLDYERAMRERNRLLKDMVRDGQWYAALEGQMAASGARITASRRAALDRLTLAQEVTATDFPAARLDLTPEEPDLARALAASRPRDLQAGRTLVGPHRADLTAHWLAKDMPAAQCSTGEQKALLISVILAAARALGSLGRPAPILLMDEVAAHLDAGRRAALHDALCALPAQSFLTGTGRELFDSLGPRAQYLEVSEVQGLSQLAEVPFAPR